MFPVIYLRILKIASENFKNCWDAPVVEPLFSKVTEEISAFDGLCRELYHIHCYVSKSRSFRNFEKFSFSRSCRLTAYRLQRYQKRTLDQNFQRCFENFEKCSGRALLWSFFIVN